MLSKAEKVNKVKEYLKEFALLHGFDTYVGIKTVSKETDIPELELFNHEKDTGILWELDDEGMVNVLTSGTSDFCVKGIFDDFNFGYGW